MSDSKNATAPEAEKFSAMPQNVRMLEMDLIERDPTQPREDAAEPDGLGILQASFRQVNIVHAITVRPHPAKAGRYMIVVGERRWCAATGLGAKEIPAVVREGLSDLQALKIQVAENFKGGRASWRPSVVANALERLMKEEKKDQAALAKDLGVSQPTIAQLLALKNLDPNIAAFRDANPRLTKDRTTLVSLDKLYKRDPARANAIMQKAVEDNKLPRAAVAGMLKETKKESAPAGKAAEKTKPKDAKQLDNMLGPDEAHAGDVEFRQDLQSGTAGTPPALGTGPAPGVAPDTPSAPAMRRDRVSQKKVRQVTEMLGRNENMPLEELLELLMDNYVQTRMGVSASTAGPNQRPVPQLQNSH